MEPALSATTLPPRDFASLREAIAARAGDLPRRLGQVAGFALAHPDEEAFGTAASVAQQAGVQPSTLVRFSQAFGYDGFSDLQEIFRQRLRGRVTSYEERLRQVRTHEAGMPRSGLVLDGFIEAAERSIADFRAKLEPEALEAAVRLLAEADTIFLVGARRSFPVATYLAYALARLGIRYVLVDGAGGLAADQIELVRPTDAVLAISFTPYASETVALAQAGKRRDAKLISITDSVFSPIAPVADAWLGVTEADFDGFRSLAATMALAGALAVAIADRRAR